MANYAAVKAAATDEEEGVRFELTGGVSFTLSDITLSELRAANFIL